MGQRTIDTVIRLQNESEYRQSLRNCTSEMKTMKSELALVASEFRNNANSMEALSARGDVLSRMYDTQQQKVGFLQGALEKANEVREAEQLAVSELGSQYAQAKKALEDLGNEIDESSKEYQEARAEVDRLRDAYIQHQSKLDSATSSVNKYSTQLNRAKIELDQLEDQQEQNTRLLEEARQSADGCARSIDKYGDTVKQAADNTQSSASAVDALATALVASGVQQKVEDVAASLMEASTAAQAYELSIAKVSTIADTSVMAPSDLRAGILEQATALRRDANEVAYAAYDALSAGVDTAHVLEFTAAAAQLAEAGFTDVGTSVDVLTSILNAYKLEADQTEAVASKLVKTQDLGKITVDELGTVIGRVIPSAAAYGVNLDNVAAAYARMTASGINAENTTTYVSAMLDELADSGSNVATILVERTGQSFAELMQSGKSLGDVLDILGASVEHDKVQFSNLWSSATAGKAAISLLGDSADDFNSILDQMANSSGSVAANYKTMTENSDYASRRLQVASNNLKIAVGEQLNPALDKLRNAGASILETAADIIEKNPWLVSAVSGLVTALGLLASGLSALMIVKSVTTAFQALNITLAANPIGLVTIAVAGLVTALMEFSQNTDTSTQKVGELTSAAQALKDAAATSGAAYAETVSSAEAAAAMVDSYIDRLQELEAQGVETQAQQLEYSMILEKIQALIPDLNFELDEQTKLVKGGAEGLRELADGWKEAAIAEATYTRYKEDIAAFANEEYELAKNQALLSIAEKDAVRITDELTASERELREAKEAVSSAAEAESSSLGAISPAVLQAQSRVTALTKEHYALSAQLVMNKKDQQDLKSAIEICTESVEAARPVAEAATEAYTAMSAQVDAGSKQIEQSSGTMADVITETSEEIQAAYAEMYDAARDSIDRQIGLFDDLSGKSELTVEEMIANLQSQREAFDNYADNLILAVGRGIDIGLVQKLSDGSKESMLILQELVSGTESQIDQINEAFLAVGDSKDYVASVLVDVQQLMDDELTIIHDDVYAKALEIGIALALGIANGAGRGVFNVQDVITSVTSVGGTSTSGLSSSEPLRFTDSGIPITGSSIVAAAAKKASSVASGGTGSGRTDQLLQDILTETRNGKIVVLDSGVVIGATAGGFDEQFGTMKILTDRGAS